jgi:class III poly(R)-hydroxyalkanoic acid synthase PhaE subunit
MNEWFQFMTQMWTNATKMWMDTLSTSGFQGSASESEDGSESYDNLHRAYENMLKMYQSSLSIFSEPGTFENIFKGVNLFPQAMSQITQSGLEGFYHLHRIWMNEINESQSAPDVNEYVKRKKDDLQAMMESYEQHFRQIFHVPQLGLTRVYQEHINEALDKFNQFLLAMNEFNELCYYPVQKSLLEMHEKFEELSSEGTLSDNPKEYYKMWVGKLEGHYMQLFQSPEYLEVMHKLINAFEDFHSAQKTVVNDALKYTPLPSQDDVEALAREHHQLKKRIRQLEAQLENKE